MEQRLARLFKALSDPNRLRIFALLVWKDSLTVGEMAEFLGLSQPLVSSHLRRLREAGWVEARRQGRAMAYSLRLELPLEMEIVEYALRRIFSTDEYQDMRRRLNSFLKERYAGLHPEKES